MDPLVRLGAAEIAASIARGEVSSREVMEAHLRRIDEVNPHLNAVVRRLDDDALAAADEADRVRAAGHPLGVLHGVPFTVKENIAVAGTPTTNGMRLFAESISPRDDPAVEWLREAGAIPIGRTNLPDSAFRPQTRSSLHGLTTNPWDPAHTVGGSSGGEGAAISAGMSPLGLGTDIGGSVRIPAHCCGVAAIKPTTGVVPAFSSHPSTIGMQLMAVTGVVARRVEDLVVGLRAIAGQHRRDPRSTPAVLAEPTSPLRVCVQANPRGIDVHPDVADLVIQRPQAVQHLDPGVVRFMDRVIAQQPDLGMTAWSAALSDRFRLQRQWSKLFGQFDAVLAPTLTVPAMDLDADIATEASADATLAAFAPTRVASVAGLPAVTVPVGVADDTPISVQLMGAPFHDLLVLDCAAVLEEAFGTFTPIDPRA